MITDFLITLVFILLFAIPIIGVVLTAKGNSFVKIFSIHSMIFVSYTILTIFFSELITGYDEYGIGQIALFALFIIVHILISSIYVLYKTIKKS
jgi:heme/copper-type cytochrome/quinol oxidase subunit 4